VDDQLICLQLDGRDSPLATTLEVTRTAAATPMAFATTT
jgi:hypothetical protein